MTGFYNPNCISDITDSLIEEYKKKNPLGEEYKAITSPLVCFAIADAFTRDEVKERVNLLLNPIEVAEKNLWFYLVNINTLIFGNTMITYFYKELYSKVSIQRTPRNIYNLMRNIKFFSTYFQKEFYDHIGLIDIVLGYMLANNITDTQIIYYVLNHGDEINVDLELNGIKIVLNQFEEIDLNSYKPISEAYQFIVRYINNKTKKLVIK